MTMATFPATAIATKTAAKMFTLMPVKTWRNTVLTP